MKKTLCTAVICTVWAVGLWGCRKKADEGGDSSRSEEVVQGVSSRPAQPAEPDRAGEEAATKPAEKIAIKVLYAGVPGTERAEDFAAFLNAHFVEVGRVAYEAFTPEQVGGYDVVVLDYDGLGTNAPVPELPQDYVWATVTVGVPGADLGSRLRLKTGYL